MPDQVVERTVTFATVVDDLSEAWAFIMARLDGLGLSPSMTISPLWEYGEGEESVRRFEVSVSGMVEEAATGEDKGNE